MLKPICLFLVFQVAVNGALDYRSNVVQPNEHLEGTAERHRPTAGQHASVKLSPYDKYIEAEHYSAKSDGIANAVDALDNNIMASISDGDYLRYDNIDFADGANRVDIVVGELLFDTPGHAGDINLRLGGLNASSFVKIPISYTTGTYKCTTISQYLDTVPTGAQTLYITFTTTYGTNYNLANLDKFMFHRY